MKFADPVKTAIMTKRFIFIFFLLVLIQFQGFAQDTSAYAVQRAKINELLAKRSANFGQYSESLTQKTGIFGLQTKKDIRKSNEILRQIAINDNHIFQELKVLMEYKDLQMAAVKNTAASSEERFLNYRKTIKELQDQNQQLNLNVEIAEKRKDLSLFLLLTFLAVNIIFGILLLKKNQKIKNLQQHS